MGESGVRMGAPEPRAGSGCSSRRASTLVASSAQRRSRVRFPDEQDRPAVFDYGTLTPVQEGVARNVRQYEDGGASSMFGVMQQLLSPLLVTAHCELRTHRKVPGGG
jgi:hypothetical protein